MSLVEEDAPVSVWASEPSHDLVQPAHDLAVLLAAGKKRQEQSKKKANNKEQTNKKRTSENLWIRFTGSASIKLSRAPGKDSINLSAMYTPEPTLRVDTVYLSRVLPILSRAEGMLYASKSFV